MTDSPKIETRVMTTPEKDRRTVRGRYLPAARVVEELVRHVPNLTHVADELRHRLDELPERRR